jgi:hypothetical protein
MANRAEECRLRAEQCEQTASAATDPTEQRIYAELAKWRQMAAQCLPLPIGKLCVARRRWR